MNLRSLLSVTNKNGIENFAKMLIEAGYPPLSTGGTGGKLKEAGVAFEEVSLYTGESEILDGRVKTINRKLFAGVVARPNAKDEAVLKKRHWDRVDVVAVNLYDFVSTITKDDVTMDKAVDSIDVGGPTYLAAAAKNHKRVWVVCDPGDYDRVGNMLLSSSAQEEQRAKMRLELSVKAFLKLQEYYSLIAPWMRKQYEMM